MMDYYIDHATHKDIEIFTKSGVLKLKRGQLFFAQRALADELGCGRQQIRARQAIMESVNFSTHKTTQHYTIATVLNYDKYQEAQPTDQPTNQPTPNPRPTQYKELKELKEELLFIALPTNRNGDEYQVTVSFRDEMQQLYQAVDVDRALKSMKAWLISNPKNRKTKSGMPRFINSWLSREQNRAPRQTEVQEAEQAWLSVMAEVKRNGAHGSPVFEPRTYEALKRVGGYHAVCMTTERFIDKKRQEFISCY